MPLDLNDPSVLVLLQSELQRVFAVDARHLYPLNKVTLYGPSITKPTLGSGFAVNTVYGCHLAFEQSAWMDISYGWEDISECPAQRRCTDTQYKLCPLGGRFYRNTYSIGD